VKIKGDGQNINFANAFTRPFSDAVEIYLADKQPGRLTVISGLVATSYEYKEGETVQPSPAITINRESAVRLMDAFWNIGIRPSQDAQSVGQLAAIEKHLKDMRRLAFKVLKVDEP
jgi:hypothetical protein